MRVSICLNDGHATQVGLTYCIDLGDIGLPLEVVQDRVLRELLRLDVSDDVPQMLAIVSARTCLSI